MPCIWCGVYCSETGHVGYFLNVAPWMLSAEIRFCIHYQQLKALLRSLCACFIVTLDAITGTDVVGQPPGVCNPRRKDRQCDHRWALSHNLWARTQVWQLGLTQPWNLPSHKDASSYHRSLSGVPLNSRLSLCISDKIWLTKSLGNNLCRNILTAYSSWCWCKARIKQEGKENVNLYLHYKQSEGLLSMCMNIKNPGLFLCLVKCLVCGRWSTSVY